MTLKGGLLWSMHLGLSKWLEDLNRSVDFSNPYHSDFVRLTFDRRMVMDTYSLPAAQLCIPPKHSPRDSNGLSPS